MVFVRFKVSGLASQEEPAQTALRVVRLDKSTWDGANRQPPHGSRNRSLPERRVGLRCSINPFLPIPPKQLHCISPAPSLFAYESQPRVPSPFWKLPMALVMVSTSPPDMRSLAPASHQPSM